MVSAASGPAGSGPLGVKLSGTLRQETRNKDSSVLKTA
jgi:hypothetical protein